MPKHELSRRRFLTEGLKFVGAAMLTAAGMHIGRTEIIPPWGMSLPIDRLTALAAAELAALTTPTFFGPQALENNTPFDDPVWDAINHTKQAFGREDSIGVFAVVQDLRKAQAVRHIEQEMLTIHQRGTIPMLNVSVGGEVPNVHPLDQRNWPTVESQLQQLFVFLAALDIPHCVRLNYEFNGSWFVFGRGRELPDPEHEASIRWLFSTASRMMSSLDPKGNLIFSPNVGSEILGYVPLREKALDSRFNRHELPLVDNLVDIATPQDAAHIQSYLHSQQEHLNQHNDALLSQGESVLKTDEDKFVAAGTDGYIWFPGRGKIGQGSYWIPWQNVTPEAVYLNSFIDLMLAFPDLPKLVTEVGNAAMDEEVMFRTFALHLALGAVGFMPFIVNRDSENSPGQQDSEPVNWMHTAGTLGLIAKLM